MKESIDEKLKRALERRRSDWRAISVDAEVSLSWLSQFCRGKIPNPGIRTLERLRATLSPKRGAK